METKEAREAERSTSKRSKRQLWLETFITKCVQSTCISFVKLVYMHLYETRNIGQYSIANIKFITFVWQYSVIDF